MLTDLINADHMARRGGGGAEVKPIPVFSQYQSAGADTGFRKGGGGSGQLLSIKRGVFARTRTTFFSLFMKFGGPPEGGGEIPDPQDPPPGSAPL